MATCNVPALHLIHDLRASVRAHEREGGGGNV